MIVQRLNNPWLLLPLMAFGLGLFYRTGFMPIAWPILGGALFAALALWRPDLALLFVPFTAPLYLMPSYVPGFFGAALPLHELTLLAAAAGTALHLAWPHERQRRARVLDVRLALSMLAFPIAMFVVAAVLGVTEATPEGRGAALRELRWLVIEPLIFVALAVYWALEYRRRASVYGMLLLGSYALSSLLVALIGVLQLAGIDLVPLFGWRRAFSETVVADSGVLRVTSVYGHPNNLGLALGRAWPVAAALAFGLWRLKRFPLANFFALAAVVSLAGLAASLSRGAWLGALAAGAVLALTLYTARGRAQRVRRWPIIAGVLVLGGVVLGLALSLRPEGGSVDARVLLWGEALAYLRLHPVGIGLDQFYYYHNPEFGRSLIDPTLIGTSEEFAAHPHNLLLDTWLRLGPLGVAAFIWLIAAWVRTALVRARSGALGAAVAAGTLAALAAALTHGLVDNFYFVPDLAFVFWLLITAACVPALTEPGVSATMQALNHQSQLDESS
jgi:O-antigen ligase